MNKTKVASSFQTHIVEAMWHMVRFFLTVAIAIPLASVVFRPTVIQVMTAEYRPEDAALTIFNQGLALGAGGAAMGIAAFYVIWELINAGVEAWSLWKGRGNATNT